MHLIFEQYADRLQRRGRARGTLSAFKQAAARYDRWLDEQGLRAEDATFAEVESYLDGLPLAASTQRTHLANIRAAYHYARRRGLLSHDPTLDIEIGWGDDVEPEIIPGEALRAIKANITQDRDWLLFHLLAYTGARRNEIRQLSWEAVQLPQASMRVLGKGSKIRHVPIHPALAEVLVEFGPAEGAVLAGGGASGGISDNTFQEATKRLHHHYTPHAYRRTVATSLVRNGVEERQVDRILGWAPRSVRGRYYVNVAPEELQRAILKLYADDPI